MRNRRIISLLLILVITLTMTVTAEAKIYKPSGKTNWQIVKQLAKKTGKPIKLVDEIKTPEAKLWNLIEHRKGKPYVLVTKVVSVGNGTDHGWYTTKEGFRYIIGYNKKVPKGKKVTSYIIWNPKTNYEDDILYVVDNRMYRG